MWLPIFRIWQIQCRGDADSAPSVLRILQENLTSFGVVVFGYLDNWSYPVCESFELFKMDTR
jgi:hypothetical protein